MTSQLNPIAGIFSGSEPAGTIKAIDRHSVHQICSGQVVLTLATAVKELVENSIDAGATNVDIKLKDSGTELVEVSDNGKGVEEVNFEGLTLKHHTSKLKDFSDLIHVETFGFRGEALSSLCALSDLSVVTCHEAAQVGTKLVFDHNGHLTQRSPHPRQQGTTVSLSQLFYTLPVRHKEFQRNIKKEYTKMIHVLQSYCIVSTGVRITCTNQTGQGKRTPVLCTSGKQSMRDNIGAIFGPKQLQSLLLFQQLSPTDNIKEDYGLSNADLPKDLFTISGFVSRGDHGVGRSATDRQFFYINNRPCDPSKVSKVVNEVYHMFNRHQYPFVALNITVASECVDVNVTPDKRQIFLQEEKLLLAIMKSSLIAMYETGVNKISLNHMSYSTTSKHTLQDSYRPAEPPSDMEGCQVPSSEMAPEAGDDSESVIPSPQPFLNLAGLKAAFSMHNSPGSGSKSSATKAANTGPTQKKLQSFFGGSDKSQNTHGPSLQSPLKSSRGAVKCSPVGRSVLEGFRYGRTPNSDVDSGRESVLSEHSFPTATPESLYATTGSEFNSPDITVDDEPIIKSEALDEPFNEERTVAKHFDRPIEQRISETSVEMSFSPNAKKAKLEDGQFSSEYKTTHSASSEGSSGSNVDAPVCVQKRAVPLQFSVQELFGRVRRLQEQRREKAEDGLRYRRFRAKISPGENQSAEDELKKEICKDSFKDMEIIGQFNLGFIITKLNSDIFMIDQHATDEKYNFEMLQQHTALQGQRLIVPQNLHLTAVSENVLMENLEIFRKNGFDFLIDEEAQVMERVKLVSLPTSKNWTFGPGDIEELIFMLSDSPGVMCRPSRVRQMFASRACRKSVMIGTALSTSEMKKLVVHMGEIEQPWNCPHGRPTMRHLVNLNIISED
ncbi:mismatch repair endonuclease PMS2-like isoform X2 [Salvelinus alpinus]|uniref:mismatch repair endonuclease PMS2-like isoform X2 n=1 Tax=Salvelinus alpinus TaxID=8036 RepID=UPI0039FC2926